MIHNLEDIYDPGGSNNGSSSSTKPEGKTIESITAPSAADVSPISMGNTSNVDVSDYTHFLDNGVFTTRNIDLERGQRQSILNKVATRVANIVPNIAASLVDMVGDVGDILGQWGDNRTYNNAFNQAATAMKNPFGEVYARTDRSTLGSTLSDPGWWIDNIAGAAELAAPFALAGAGVGGLMDRIASGAADLMQLPAAGVQAARAMGQLGTSAFMSYTMAAQGGAKVFQDVYGKQYQNLLMDGKSPQEAHEQAVHIAAQSAATTVQLGTMIGTALNVTSLAPYFRNSEAAATSILRENLPKLAGEAEEAWQSRVANLSIQDPAIKTALMPGQSLLHKSLDAVKMGTEMAQLQFGEKTGEALGDKGKTKGFFEQMGEMENFFERVGDKDGLLAFATGAAAGLGMHYLQHNVLPSKWIDKVADDGTPIQKRDKDEQLMFDEKTGNPIFQKQLVTPKTYDATMTTRKFTNMRDAVAQDITNFNEMKKDWAAALAKGDTVEADKIKGEMYRVNQLNAVKLGITEPWVGTFNEIANYDNKELVPQANGTSMTEAQAKGFSTGVKDNDYQKKATSAVADLHDYKKVYDDLQKKYGTLYHSNEGMKDLVDMVFARKIDLMGWDKTLKEHEEKLAKLEADETQLAHAANPEGLNESIFEYNRTLEGTKQSHALIKVDFDALTKAIDKQDRNAMLKLVKKYRAAGMSEDDLQGAVDNLHEKLNAAVERSSKKLNDTQDAMFNSSGYTDWLEKNPGKKFTDFIDEINKRTKLSQSNSDYRASIEYSREQHKIAKQNLAEIESERSLPKFAKKANDWIEKLRADIEESERHKTANILEMAKDKGAVGRIARLQINAEGDKYRKMQADVDKQHADNVERLTKLNEEYKKLSTVKDPLRKLALRKQISQLEEENKQLKAKSMHYASRAEDNTIADDDPNPIPVSSLVNENSDVENETEEDPLREEPDIAEPITDPNEPTPVVVPSPAVVVPKEVEPEEMTVLGNADEDPHFKALSNYVEETTKHSVELQGTFQNIEDAIKEGAVFSLDLLRPEVTEGKISQEDATRLLQAMKDFLDLEEQAKAEDEVQAFAEDPAVIAVDEAPIQHIDIAEVPPPDSPIIDNSDESLGQEIPDTGNTHKGAKISNVLSVANSTIGYKEHLQDGKYIKIADPTQLNVTNPAILQPNGLPPQHPIRFEVDTAFDGDINRDEDIINRPLDSQRAQTNDKFTNHIGQDGKIINKPANVGNVPIKIVDATNGKTIGYVRRLDWVTQQYPGTLSGDPEQYRNVQTLYDKNGDPLPIQDTHMKDIMRIRQQIVDSWNNGGKHTDGHITAKGTGMVLLNRVEEVKGKEGKPREVEMKYARADKPEDSLLPDKDLDIAIVGSGTAFTGFNYEFPGEKAYDKVDLPDGSVVTMLPTPNGTHTYAPLIGDKLITYNKDGTVRNNIALKTITRALELYLLNDGVNEPVKNEIKGIKDNTGHDVSTEAGLKNFINQYFTYTQSFKKSQLSGNTGIDAVQEKFVFNVWDKEGDQNKGDIGIGFTASGRPQINASLVNGKLSPEFVKVLEEGLATRSRAVVYTDTITRNLRGINNKDGTFNGAIYTANGKWKHKEYESYNEYVKSFSKTAVYGRNRLNGDKGPYVYTANPQMEFDVHAAAKDTNLQVKPNESAKEVVLPETKKVVVTPKETVPSVDYQKLDNNSKEQFIKDNTNINRSAFKTQKEFIDYFEAKRNRVKDMVDAGNKEGALVASGIIPSFIEVLKKRDGIDKEYQDVLNEYGLNEPKETKLPNTQEEAETKQPEPVVVPKVDTPPITYDADAANLFDSFTDFSIETVPKIVKGAIIGDRTDNQPDFTPENLEKLYNFTPEEQRNGTTVKEVYNKFNNRHSFIPDKWNPFSRCL